MSADDIIRVWDHVFAEWCCWWFLLIVIVGLFVPSVVSVSRKNSQ